MKCGLNRNVFDSTNCLTSGYSTGPVNNCLLTYSKYQCGKEINVKAANKTFRFIIVLFFIVYPFVVLLFT